MGNYNYLRPVSRSGKVLLSSLFVAWLGATGGAVKSNIEVGATYHTKAEIKKYQAADVDVIRLAQATQPFSLKVGDNAVTSTALRNCPDRGPACLINYSENIIHPGMRKLERLYSAQSSHLLQQAGTGALFGLVVGAFTALALTRKKKNATPPQYPPTPDFMAN